MSRNHGLGATANENDEAGQRPASLGKNGGLFERKKISSFGPKFDELVILYR